MMKKILLLTYLLLISYSLLIAQPSVIRPGHQDSVYTYQYGSWSSHPSIWVYLPWDYYITNKNYPVIIFFNGSGENGTYLDVTLTQGLPYVINSGNAPYSINSLNDTTRFIVISPQAPDPWHIDDENKLAWQTLVTDSNGYRLRVDTNRIYVTGLSQGGSVAVSKATFTSDGFTPAASVSFSMSGSMNSIYYDSSVYVNTPIWFLGGNSDNVVGNTAQNSYNWLRSINSNGKYRLSIYNGGHCCWTTMYDPSWTDLKAISNSSDTSNMSIYDWMLQYKLHSDTVGLSLKYIKKDSTKSYLYFENEITHKIYLIENN